MEFTNCGTWFAGSVEKLRHRRINSFGYDRGMVSLAPHRILNLQHRSSSVDSASGHQYYYQFPVFQFSRLWPIHGETHHCSWIWRRKYRSFDVVEFYGEPEGVSFAQTRSEYSNSAWGNVQIAQTKLSIVREENKFEIRGCPKDYTGKIFDDWNVSIQYYCTESCA